MNELFDRYASWQILQYFALNPTKEAYVNEIAEKLSLSSGICSKTLKELLELNILEKRKLGREHYYKLANNYLTKELKRFIGLFMIHEAGLVNKIAEASEGLTSIALYGSYATGEFNANSDIDLLIISLKKQKILMRTLEQTIGKDINIQSFSIGQWLKMKKESDSFYLTVVKSHILLYGSELP
jgi:predicted nucleotidyltransferase